MNALILSILFCAAEKVLCLRCYSCPDTEIKYCSDPFPTNSSRGIEIVKCIDQYDKCLKFREAVEPQYVYRGCGEDAVCRAMRRYASECSTCKEDLCNRSITLIPISAASIFNVLLLKALC